MNENDKTVPNGKTAYDADATVIDSRTVAEHYAPGAADEAYAQGSLLLGTYRIESAAIKGGMGAVWRVHHSGWNVDLAMKRPQPQMFAGETAKQNFISECQSWIDLGLHPNIVSCHYVREIDGVPTIFSEWMENGSLENHIADGTLYKCGEKEQQSRLLDIAIQFARGLHYAHESGLIHQDVKPDNLLLTNDWQAKVADFGLAKARGVLTMNEQSENAGATHMAASGGYTPAYCSMEQMDGKPLTRRTDIYSWAVSVMEMYLGSRPWQNGVVAGMSCRTYFEGGKVPMPDALKELLAKCLAAEPDGRPHDFAAVETELHRIYRQAVGENYPRPQPTATAGNAESLNNRALSYLDLGLADKAEKAWKEALKATPNHLDTVYNQGLYEWRQALVTVEEVKHHIMNAQGADDVKARMLQSFDTEAKQLEPRVIDRGYDNLKYDGTRVQGAASRDGRWVYLLRNDAANDMLTYMASNSNNLDGLFCLSPVMVKWRYPQRFRIQLPIGRYLPDFLVLSPDEKYALYNLGDGDYRKKGSDDQVHIVNLITEREEGKLIAGAKTACFHPNSRYCYTAEGSVVRKWELQTRACLTTYRVEGEKSALKDMRLCVSQDGTRLYCAGKNYILQFDEATGDMLRRCSPLSVAGICVSPDGQTLYSCGAKGVEVWQTDTMTRQAWTPGRKKFNNIWLSPDGNRLLLTAEDGEIQLWDAHSRICRQVFRGQQGPIHSLSASDDLSVILTCSTGKKAYAWSAGRPENSAAWEVSRVRSYEEQISESKESDALAEELRAALDGRQIDRALELLARAESEFDPLRFLPLRRELMACCRRGAFRDTVDLAFFQVLDAPQHGRAQHALCPDPRGGACAFINQARNRIAFFTEDGRELPEREITRSDLGRSVQISRTGRYIAAGAQQSAVVWSGTGKKPLWVIRGFAPVHCPTENVGDFGKDLIAGARRHYVEEGFTQGSNVKIAFSPDEKTILAGDYNDLGIWSLANGKRLHTLSIAGSRCDYDYVSDVCFSPAGERAYASELGGCVHVFNTKTGDSIAKWDLFSDEWGWDAIIFHIHLSPDGRRLYACGCNHIRVVDTWTGEKLEDFHPYTHNARYDFCLSPDGTMAAECTPEGVKLWSLPDKMLLREFPALRAEPKERCLAFSPDSAVLYAMVRDSVYTIVIRREMTFSGWQEWDPAADVYRDHFHKAYPEAKAQQAELFLREMQNRGFGYIRPGSAPKPEPKPDPKPPTDELDDLLADLARQARTRMDKK